MKTLFAALCLSLLFGSSASVSAADTDTEIKDPSVSGGVADGKVRLVIEGLLTGHPGDRERVIFSTELQESIKVTRDKLTSQIAVELDILQGKPKELALTISEDSEIKQVTGPYLQDWSIREEADGERTLILRPKKSDQPITKLSVTIVC